MSNEAVMSLISLCLTVGKPPLAQDSAWSTVKAWPHSHLVGNFDGVQQGRLVQGEPMIS